MPDRPPGWTPPLRRFRLPRLAWWHVVVAGLLVAAGGAGVALFGDWWSHQPACDGCGANIGAGFIAVAGIGVAFAGLGGIVAGLIMWWDERKAP